MNNTISKDQQFVWHPFTRQKGAEPAVNIIKGDGVYLIDEKGKPYIDAISSWWVNLHGHCHPYISQKVSQQLFTLEHSLFSGFTHEPGVTLAERLIKHLPENQKKIFYSDNGSTAVEVALKMALQYWNNQAKAKTTFIAFENAYHGDTFGGMSVGARNVFNNAFENLLFDVVHIPVPVKENYEQVMQQLLDHVSGGNIAGFIFEPLVQGAAGMLMYEAHFLDELIRICKEHHVLTIADEVMTGFGRTGRFFASDHLSQNPDIISLSKGLTGGYMPLGVTSCTESVFDAFVTDDKSKTFFHGHSYTANPTACSAALASLDLMEEEPTWKQISMISESHLGFAQRIRTNSRLRSVRTLGTIMAFELNTKDHTHYLNDAAQSITDFFLQRGIIIRPLGNVFYLIPPYVISKKQLDGVYDAIEAFLNV